VAERSDAQQLAATGLTCCHHFDQREKSLVAGNSGVLSLRSRRQLDETVHRWGSRYKRSPQTYNFIAISASSVERSDAQQQPGFMTLFEVKRLNVFT
jgi:hypothetical protein